MLFHDVRNTLSGTAIQNKIQHDAHTHSREFLPGDLFEHIVRSFRNLSMLVLHDVLVSCAGATMFHLRKHR